MERNKEVKNCACCQLEKEIDKKKCVCDSCMTTKKGIGIATRELLRENPKLKAFEICKILNIEASRLYELIQDGTIKVSNIEPEYEEEFQKIKSYLLFSVPRMAYEISAATGVSLEIIYKLVEQGRLIQVDGGIKINMRLKQNRKRNRNKSFRQKYSVEYVPIRKSVRDMDENEKSKLVEDLEALYGKKDQKGEDKEEI